MGGCASKVPDETTSTQRKEPSTKGSANGSLRTAGTATTMPGPDDSIDRRKMLAGARTKLQMEVIGRRRRRVAAIACCARRTTPGKCG